jgi:hypothetical protein
MHHVELRHLASVGFPAGDFKVIGSFLPTTYFFSDLTSLLPRKRKKEEKRTERQKERIKATRNK